MNTIVISPINSNVNQVIGQLSKSTEFRGLTLYQVCTFGDSKDSDEDPYAHDTPNRMIAQHYIPYIAWDVEEKGGED